MDFANWKIKTRLSAGFGLMLVLLAYHWPHMRNLAIGLYERAKIFLMRVGTTILTLMVLLWAQW